VARLDALAASNFKHLRSHDVQLLRLGQLAERYFSDDPNTCLLKLRQLAELLAQLTASRVGLFTSTEENQVDLLRRLQDHGILPRDVAGLFHEVRRAGNAANHRLSGDHRAALTAMRFAWQIGVWFHQTFSDPVFKSGPFLPPASPRDESAELKAELDELRSELEQFRHAHQQAVEARSQAEAQARKLDEDRAFWEAMAADEEAAKSELANRLAALQAQGAVAPPQFRPNGRLGQYGRGVDPGQ
jgi:type I restriction enzyme R subunit